MDHAAVQHAREANVGGPSLFPADFGHDDGVRHGFADDGVLANWLHRRIALDCEAQDAREVPADGNGELAAT